MFHESHYSPAYKKLAYQLVLGNRTIITCHEVLSYEETKVTPPIDNNPVRHTSDHQTSLLNQEDNQRKLL